MGGFFLIIVAGFFSHSPVFAQVNGTLRYNSGLSAFQFYENGQWVEYGTGSGGGGSAPQVVATVESTGLTANVSNVTIYTPAADGIYAVLCQVTLQVPAATSATVPGCRVVYTEQISNTSVTRNLFNSTASNVLGAGQSALQPIYVKSGTAIQYTTISYASSPANTMQYAVQVVLYKLP